MALITAIDFTSSNGLVNQSNSLHSLVNANNNQYRGALKSVSEILINYDYDKLVPMYGFGGKPKLENLFSNVTMHCFPLNGKKDEPEVYGISGVMNSYEYAIAHSELSGPTLFHPIIEESMKVAQGFKDEGSDQYAILFILTDGVIFDMKETKRAIVDSALLPLSIIIVGVGNANFENMNVLDGDDGLWDDNVKKKINLNYFLIIDILNLF